MKRIAKTAIWASLAATLAAGPVLAESIERPHKNPDREKISTFSDFFSSFRPAKKSGATTPAKPVIEKPAIAVTDAPEKRKPKARKAKIRKNKAPVEVATSKPRDKEADWWKTVGNPAVFAFRDCSVGYAKSQATDGNVVSPAKIITTAMKTSCQIEFAKMAGVLIGGLGEKRSNAMLTELAKTTFLPPVKEVLDEQRGRQIAKAAVTNAKEKLETAKAGMFRCFSERTDRLVVAKNIQANTIADAVLAGCQAKSDAFFDLLFANSKASPQIKQQQKAIALNETYKIAIVRRVLASRKPSQVKTVVQQ